MAQITTNSQIERLIERTASLKAAAEAKRLRNDAACERQHLNLMRKVEHEFDDSFGSGGILRRGLAQIRNNSLVVPAERKRQLVLSASGRSFHGKGATYNKASASKPNASKAGKGRKRAASSGAAHYRYLEGPDQDPSADGTAATKGGHVSYIDGSRVECAGEGERLSRSNIKGDGTIKGDFETRMRFFELAEMFERDSHGDSISLELNRVSPELAAALADAACDPAVRAAIQTRPAHDDEPLKIKLEGSARDLRKLIKSHGIEPSTAKTNAERLQKDGIAFHSGRSGRTHFRWVFELPKEFSAKQRKQVLDDLCAHMQDLKCMYAAVIHAPDPFNDERNYHLHLIFYDRPCRRLTGTNADLENVAKAFKPAIQKEIAAGDIQAGEWDFAAQRHYKSIRTWKTHYPFRAEKSREVTKGREWQQRFRKEYAGIVNAISVASGGSATYDPRSYNDRGVDISPSKHLGRWHKDEIVGIPTLIGLSNERNQAADQRRAILDTHNVELARLDTLDLKLTPYRPEAMVDNLASKLAAKRIEDIAEARSAAEASLAIELWDFETARERSRANLVRDRQERASEKGSARDRRDRKALANAAQAHLDALTKQDAAMLRIVGEMQREIDWAPTVTQETVELTVANCQTALQLGSQKITPPKIAEADPIDPTASSELASTAPSLTVAPTVEDKGAVAEVVTAASSTVYKPGGEPKASELADHVQSTVDTRPETTRPPQVIPPFVRGPNVETSATTDRSETGVPPNRHDEAGRPILQTLAITTEIEEQKPKRAVDKTPARNAHVSGDVGSPTPTDKDHPKAGSPAAVAPAESETIHANVLTENATTPPARPFLTIEARPTQSQSSSDSIILKERIRFEQEIILHIVRTERISLHRMDGALVVPDHERIPSEWHRHVPFLQTDLASSQVLIEAERKAFVKLIDSDSYEPKSRHVLFFHKVFARDPDVQQAMVKGAQRAAEQLARQYALAAHQSRGLA